MDLNKTVPVGTVFVVRGIKYRCERATKDCDGCAWWERFCAGLTPPCEARFRSDSNDVIFKRV